VTDAERRADVLVQNLKKPRPDLFETPWWQFFYATSIAASCLVEDPWGVEAAFVAHPEYDAAIVALCPGVWEFSPGLLRRSWAADTNRGRVMGKRIIIGDTPEAKAAREAKQARLRQMVTIGSALIKQRDKFIGKLTKRELHLRHQLDTSARSYQASCSRGSNLPPAPSSTPSPHSRAPSSARPSAGAGCRSAGRDTSLRLFYCSPESGCYSARAGRQADLSPAAVSSAEFWDKLG
jgi:hypothetical protein